MTQQRRKRPADASAPELKKVGVTILNEHPLELECDNCKHVWWPNLQEGGRLPRGYWKCPDGCNDDL